MNTVNLLAPRAATALCLLALAAAPQALAEPAPTGAPTPPADAASPSVMDPAMAGPGAAPRPPVEVLAPVLVTNGPVADTPANRAKYGAPLSRAGKKTASTGN